MVGPAPRIAKGSLLLRDTNLRTPALGASSPTHALATLQSRARHKLANYPCIPHGDLNPVLSSIACLVWNNEKCQG